ncbi:imidazole glycerol phosphate synthase subunit HisH [Actinobacteria bacterium IMCC25003]|nr:imidazole glycerol phosphate synthase subunit HisH [Actinobacteria bacterium IMCC25003]
MIAILDYGSGNLRSAQRAFETSGKEVVLTSDYDVALNADGLVVPGVGAFAACMQGLASVRGDQLVRERISLKRPTLGICVGMQILFARGVEHGDHEGVGVWDATAEKLQAPILPHMGWNTVSVGTGSSLFHGVENESFYFVHSYAVKKQVGAISTMAHHGEDFLAAVEDGAIAATQFHPEKSGDAGLHLIKNWTNSL